jgi:hypothetical protein
MIRQYCKWQPSDETMQNLINDSNTIDWNPVIYGIFYWRLDVVEFFADSKKVNIRNCLLTPFIIEENE